MKTLKENIQRSFNAFKQLHGFKLNLSYAFMVSVYFINRLLRQLNY